MQSTSKKLYRNTTTGLIGGVFAGLADYFGQDVVWWRLAALVIFIATGFMPGLLVYIGAWIIIPARPETEPHYHYEG